MKQNAEAEAPAEEKKETVQAPETAATEEKAEKKAEEKKEETPEEKIAKLEKAILELQDTRLRLIAEMDNLRKRSAKDLETTRSRIQRWQRVCRVFTPQGNTPCFFPLLRSRKISKRAKRGFYGAQKAGGRCSTRAKTHRKPQKRARTN